jgi:hypothetical protein
MSDAAPLLTQERAAPAEKRARHARHAPAGQHPWLVTVGVAVVYLALSALANRGAWAHGIAHSIQTAGGNDVPEEIWFLAQTPWTLLHGANPFVNNWLNAPSGINLMDNTTMPLLGIIGFPITWLFGPIATFNVLLDLSIFASALSFFVMARRFVSWWPAAFVGGLAYGFSPFSAATANGHLFLLFQAFPPLVILFVDRFLRPPKASPARAGIAVGLCFVGQFFVSTEAFASLVVMSCAALVIGVVWVLWTHTPLQGRRIAVFGGCTAIVVVVGLSYGAWVALAGPQHITGPAQSAVAVAGMSVDPVGLVVPTDNQHFTFGAAEHGDALVAQRDADWNIILDALIENGSYVGVPLLIALVAGTIALRRKRIVLFSAVMAAFALLMSMGSHLHVDGHRTGIPLPFFVIEHLPLLNSSIASRWVTYFWLFAALLLALIVDGVSNALAPDRRLGRALAALAGGVLSVVVLVPLVPAWPYSSASASVPTWFTSGARSLPAGSAALVYPLADASNDSSMLWQAMAQMQFRQPGGFAVIPNAKGVNTFAGDPSPLAGALAQCEGGASSVPAFTAADVRAQLRHWHTQTVAVVPNAPGAACARELFTRSLGPPRPEGGVLVWPNADVRS